MKRNIFSLLAAGAMVAGMLTSCSKDDTAALIDGQNNNYPADRMVRISTTLGDAQVMSRAEGTPANYTGTNLSLSVDYGEGDKYTRANILWKNNSGTWEQDLAADANPMLWKNSTTAAKIYAFAPHVSNATDLTAVPFSVQADQSVEGAIVASDLVGYKEENFVPGSSLNTLSTLNIAFTHRLSKLTVNLTYGNQYPEGARPTIEKLEVINTNLSATYNARTLDVTAPTAAGSIKAAATANTDSYEAILVPQTVAASTKLVRVTLDNGTKLSYTTPAEQLFEANKHYTLSLRIGKDKLEAGSVTVDDWTTGAEITGGEAEGRFSVWDGTRASSFAGGDGSEKNPYLITDASQLAYLATITTQFGQNYKLCTDIDLNGLEWIPIGSGDYQNRDQSSFSGTFDGDGHTIYGLKVTGTEKIRLVGLFGNVLRNFKGTTTNIAVCNLNIEKAQIIPTTTIEDMTEGCGILMGGINPGYFDGKSQTPIVSNCHVSGTIYTTNVSACIGGIIGTSNGGHFKDCSANVIVTGKNGSLVGGFGGWILNTEIENCTAKGTIEGKWSLGGFVGCVENLTSNSIITNCTTSADIVANNWNVGGFAGWTNATISGCSASGDITSGFLWNSHTYKTGGFVGTNAGTITNSSYTGTLTYTDDSQYYGGFLGNDKSGTTRDCHFDGTKNPNMATNGISIKNESIGTNDISDSLN